MVGNRLNIVPLANGFELNTGKKNITPQIPPQTIRGYNQLAVNAGAIDTPNDLVMPKSPDNHTTRLFAKAPKHPAAKKINSLFIFLSPDNFLHSRRTDSIFGFLAYLIHHAGRFFQEISAKNARGFLSLNFCAKRVIKLSSSKKIPAVAGPSEERTHRHRSCLRFLRTKTRKTKIIAGQNFLAQLNSTNGPKGNHEINYPHWRL
jgi:hypothetical protein